MKRAPVEQINRRSTGQNSALTFMAIQSGVCQTVKNMTRTSCDIRAETVASPKGFFYSGDNLIVRVMRMNDKDLIGKVHSAIYHQCRSRGFAAPVDVLMDVGYLSKQDYANWRYGRVDYLERVCKVNLSKLSLVMREMRSYATKAGLKPSFCYYKRWGTKKKNGQGRKPVIPLRFSKSGNPEIERRYATHYVDMKRTSQLKAERAAKLAEQSQPEASLDGDSISSS